MGGSKAKARVKKPKTRATHAKKPKPKPAKAKKKLPKAGAKPKKIAKKAPQKPKPAKKSPKQAVKARAKPKKAQIQAPKKRKSAQQEIIEETFAPLEKRITGLEVEIVPAILAHARHEFEYKMYSVLPHVRRIQIDIMDGKFVPNTTIGENEKVPLKDNLTVEYHLMVQNPIDYIKLIDNPDAIYIAHVEAAEQGPAEVVRFCKSEGYRVGLAINPATRAEELDRFIEDIEMVLFMTVVPGFSGQKYMKQVEGKIAEFKKKHPRMPVEVDGGIGEENVAGARQAGANLFAAASSIFAKGDCKAAIEGLNAKASGKG